MKVPWKIQCCLQDPVLALAEAIPVYLVPYIDINQMETFRRLKSSRLLNPRHRYGNLALCEERQKLWNKDWSLNSTDPAAGTTDLARLQNRHSGHFLYNKSASLQYPQSLNSLQNPPPSIFHSDGVPCASLILSPPPPSLPGCQEVTALYQCSSPRALALPLGVWKQ